ARSFIYFVGSISIFVLFSNLMSMFPLFSAPTADRSVPLACASLTFLYFNFQGIRHLGVGHYLKNFNAGTPIWIAWLIFPLELISTCARVLSLTVRLYANIFASDMIYAIFVSLLFGEAAWGLSKTPILASGLAILPFGCGLGQGRIGAAVQEGIARNPGAAKSMFVPMILALAFVETLVLLTFVTVLVVK